MTRNWINTARKLRAWSGAAGRSDERECSHLDMIHDVTPAANGCVECLAMGDTWVHLRLCLTCGHVGCCDESKNKHATRHYHDTGHPVVQAMDEWEQWMWCYADQAYLWPED